MPIQGLSNSAETRVVPLQGLSNSAVPLQGLSNSAEPRTVPLHCCLTVQSPRSVFQFLSNSAEFRVVPLQGLSNSAVPRAVPLHWLSNCADPGVVDFQRLLVHCPGQSTLFSGTVWGHFVLDCTKLLG